MAKVWVGKQSWHRTSDNYKSYKDNFDSIFRKKEEEPVDEADKAEAVDGDSTKAEAQAKANPEAGNTASTK